MPRLTPGLFSASPLIAVGLVAAAHAAEPAHADDAWIINPVFTYTHGSGSLDGWTKHGVEGETLKVLYVEGTLNDLASLRTGAAISQRLGRGYRLSAGDRVSVTCKIQNEWEGDAVRLALFHGDSPENLVVEKTFPVTNELLAARLVFTVPARATYLGAPLGLHISAVGPTTENRWVLVDDVEVEVTPAIAVR